MTLRFQGAAPLVDRERLWRIHTARNQAPVTPVARPPEQPTLTGLEHAAKRDHVPAWEAFSAATRQSPGLGSKSTRHVMMRAADAAREAERVAIAAAKARNNVRSCAHVVHRALAAMPERAEATAIASEMELLDVLFGARVVAAIPSSISLLTVAKLAEEMCINGSPGLRLIHNPQGFFLVNTLASSSAPSEQDLTALRDARDAEALCYRSGLSRDKLAAGAEAWAALLDGQLAPYEVTQESIQNVAIITYNRPDSFAQTLDSYLDSLDRYGRAHVGITVFDDSTGDNATKNRAVVNDARERGYNVRIIGVDEKTRLRTIFERALKRTKLADSPDRERVLDALLGKATPERWHGSASEQRNWAALVFGGARTLVVDDDTRAATDSVPQATIDRVAPQLVTDFMKPTEGVRVLAGQSLAISAEKLDPAHEVRPIDIIGVAENLPGYRPWSAMFTGDLDQSAKSTIDELLKDPNGSELGVVRHRSRNSETYNDKTFRGSTFVTSTDLTAFDFATFRTRNQDFQLSATRGATDAFGERPEAWGTTFVHYHARGPRLASPGRAMREEAEALATLRAFNALVSEFRSSGAPFDCEAFTRFATQRMNDGWTLKWDVVHEARVDAWKLLDNAVDLLLKGNMPPARRAALESLVADLTQELSLDARTPEAHTFEADSRARIRQELETYVRAFPYFEQLQRSSYMLAGEL